MRTSPPRCVSASVCLKPVTCCTSFTLPLPCTALHHHLPCLEAAVATQDTHHHHFTAPLLRSTFITLHAQTQHIATPPPHSRLPAPLVTHSHECNRANSLSVLTPTTTPLHFCICLLSAPLSVCQPRPSLINVTKSDSLVRSEARRR